MVEWARLVKALEDIKKVRLKPVDGGPSDMTENEKMFCAGVGAMDGIASAAINMHKSAVEREGM